MAAGRRCQWVRIFEVEDTRRHSKGYTLYKVVSTVFPRDSPEASTSVVVWRRYSELRRLHQAIQDLQQKLGLPSLPSFPRASLLNRFESEVVELRRRAALDLLNYIGLHNQLFTSEPFTRFFQNETNEGGGDGTTPDGRLKRRFTRSRSKASESLASSLGIQESSSLYSQLSDAGDISGVDALSSSTPAWGACDISCSVEASTAKFDSGRKETAIDEHYPEKDAIRFPNRTSPNRESPSRPSPSRSPRRTSPSRTSPNRTSPIRTLSSTSPNRTSPDSTLPDGSANRTANGAAVEAPIDIDGILGASLVNGIIDDDATTDPVRNWGDRSSGVTGQARSSGVAGQAASSTGDPSEDPQWFPSGKNNVGPLQAPCPSTDNRPLPTRVRHTTRPTPPLEITPHDTISRKNSAPLTPLTPLSTTVTPALPMHRAPSVHEAHSTRYIFVAARQINQAQEHELNRDYDQALELYREGVGTLLHGVQGDSDKSRREAVKRKTAQYLHRAEQLVARLTRKGKSSPQVKMDPEPEPSGSSLKAGAAELSRYRVAGVAGSVIIATDTINGDTVAIKVVVKSGGGSGGSGGSGGGSSKTVVPASVAFMVPIIRYHETSTAIYLVLKFISGGKLWNHISKYVLEGGNSGAVAYDTFGNTYAGRRLLEETSEALSPCEAPSLVSPPPPSSTGGFLVVPGRRSGCLEAPSPCSSEGYLRVYSDYAHSLPSSASMAAIPPLDAAGVVTPSVPKSLSAGTLVVTAGHLDVNSVALNAVFSANDNIHGVLQNATLSGKDDDNIRRTGILSNGSSLLTDNDVRYTGVLPNGSLLSDDDKVSVGSDTLSGVSDDFSCSVALCVPNLLPDPPPFTHFTSIDEPHTGICVDQRSVESHFQVHEDDTGVCEAQSSVRNRSEYDGPHFQVHEDDAGFREPLVSVRNRSELDESHFRAHGDDTGVCEPLVSVRNRSELDETHFRAHEDDTGVCEPLVSVSNRSELEALYKKSHFLICEDNRESLKCDNNKSLKSPTMNDEETSLNDAVRDALFLRTRDTCLPMDDARNDWRDSARNDKDDTRNDWMDDASMTDTSFASVTLPSFSWSRRDASELASLDVNDLIRNSKRLLQNVDHTLQQSKGQAMTTLHTDDSTSLQHSQLPYDSDTVGLNSGTVDLNYGSVGLNSDTVGLNSDIVGLSSDTVGLNSDTVGLKSDTVGLNYNTLGLNHVGKEEAKQLMIESGKNLKESQAYLILPTPDSTPSGCQSEVSVINLKRKDGSPKNQSHSIVLSAENHRPRKLSVKSQERRSTRAIRPSPDLSISNMTLHSGQSGSDDDDHSADQNEDINASHELRTNRTNGQLSSADNGAPMESSLAALLEKYSANRGQDSQPRLPEGIVKVWSSQVVTAIAALHQLGIVWGDFNCDNVLLDDGGSILVTYESRWSSAEQNVRSGKCWQHLGGWCMADGCHKAGYLAPELRSPLAQPTEAADWWSVGALIYHMLTGQSVRTAHTSGITSHTELLLPSHLSPEAASLLSQLLCAHPVERLGGGAASAQEIKDHAFFTGIQWR
ncbi:ribosomal protein S6 kinase delta-1 isoform X3 [Cherax quadricarinatus]|uniref:ribosomal protein S6 kinase delta-1 isoform X3 n=1 Tax=Cherax quadricarinatus TaxID=27406 RepID=UPI00387E526D